LRAMTAYLVRLAEARDCVPRVPSEVDVAVIGAGMAGIAAGCRGTTSRQDAAVRQRAEPTHQEPAMPYAAPVEEMRFVLDTLAPLDGVVERDVADAILGEAARFAAAKLAPRSQPADRIGSILGNGVVRTPPGFREAYRRYVE